MKDSMLVVVSRTADLPELGSGVVPADQYLANGAGGGGSVTVVNLCRSYRYRSKGYYVSLIADARGHRVLPAVETLEGLSEPFGLLRVLREAGVATVDPAEIRPRKRASLTAGNGSAGAVEAVPAPGRGARVPEETAETLVILGECPEPDFRIAARAIFKAWPIPLLRVGFIRRGEVWGVASVEPVPLQRLAGPARDRLVRALREGGRTTYLAESPPRSLKRASIAVLFDEDDPFTPSSPETIEYLQRFAGTRDVYVQRLGMDEIDRLGEYDALFIRALTGVREPSFQFALRAEMLGMPVLDDPQSIIRCSNKVFLDELLRREARAPRRHYPPFSVAGVELEYAVVDRDLNPASLVEDAFRVLAGKPTSDIDLGVVAFSNEIADHVFEVKTPFPIRSLLQTEEALVGGVRRFAEVLRSEFDARLLPTGMHPWMDPSGARIWRRSGAAIYQAYSRIFDLRTHGWMNVQAAHLNVPMGRGPEAAAMYNASVLVIPYLPALAAASPIFDGKLQESADNRLEWIFLHQARLPESQAEILPEYIDSLADYRRRILQPMYRALEAFPGTEALRHDFLNARGAVFKSSRRALEIRVVDMQECVKLDVAIAVFIRGVLRHYTQRILRGGIELPPHAALSTDFRSVIRHGGRARVRAPHLGEIVERDGEGMSTARDVLRHLLTAASRAIRRDEEEYLELIAQLIEGGSLSERIREALCPHRDDPGRMRAAMRELYAELADCLEENRPWPGRHLTV